MNHASEIEAKDTSEPECQNSFGPLRCHRHLSASDKNYKNCISSVCAIVHIVLSLVKFIFSYFGIKKRFCPRKACIFNILYTVRILNFHFALSLFAIFILLFNRLPLLFRPVSSQISEHVHFNRSVYSFFQLLLHLCHCFQRSRMSFIRRNLFQRLQYKIPVLHIHMRNTQFRLLTDDIIIEQNIQI